MQKIDGQRAEIILDQGTLELEIEYKRKTKKKRFRAESIRRAYREFLTEELKKL